MVSKGLISKKPVGILKRVILNPPFEIKREKKRRKNYKKPYGEVTEDHFCIKRIVRFAHDLVTIRTFNWKRLSKIIK